MHLQMSNKHGSRYGQGVTPLQVVKFWVLTRIWMWIYHHFSTSICRSGFIQCILTQQRAPLHFSPTMQPHSPRQCRSLGRVELSGHILLLLL